MNWVPRGWPRTPPTDCPDGWFKDPKFCAIALRNMVSSCVALHEEGKELYSDGERKVMLAAADHLDDFIRRTAS